MGDLVDRLLADPPAVHAMGPGAGLGVWSTEPACYRFLAEHGTGGRTLETGCGISTLLLGAVAADHTCVTPGQEEVDRLRAHAGAHDLDLTRVRFVVEGSFVALPGLAGDGELDLVLVDGGHGFPTPIVDWYYAAGRLREGGLCVLDDVHLPAVRVVTDFLDADPRWERAAGDGKWIAYRRLTGGVLYDEFTAQPWYAGPPQRRSWWLRATSGLGSAVRGAAAPG